MNSDDYLISTEFLQHRDRSLFAILFEPSAYNPKASMLYLHPFAEEMHHSRHIVATQARRLAVEGYRVMLLDLSGCGDSGGEFREATWERWLEDAEYGLQYLRKRSDSPISVWGLRLGALLATDLSQRDVKLDRLLLWQPVLNGEKQMDQFLRLYTIGAALRQEQGFDRTSLWQKLNSGQSLEVAGYELPSALALEVSRLRLYDMTPGCPVTWLEIGAKGQTDLSFASQNVISKWTDEGLEVSGQNIEGEAFWRNPDSPEVPELSSATLEAMKLT